MKIGGLGAASGRSAPPSHPCPEDVGAGVADLRSYLLEATREARALRSVSALGLLMLPARICADVTVR